MSLWGGRFTQSPADSVFALSRSIHFDWRLAPYDIVASIAHVHSLQRGGIIDPQTSKELENSLKEIAEEIAAGRFSPQTDDEDVHSALERGLKERLGEKGGAIRAGRSRNDQVVTAFKLYLIDAMNSISAELVALADAILTLAEGEVATVAPGFTHLQHAQPISFGHELAKHAVSIERDISRIADWNERTDFSPLGSGALAGSSLPLSPEETAAELGFAHVARNSIDAVSDRDFVAEALFIMAMIGIHLSRIGEEWTLWTSSEFGWASIDDAYATGSSIMPQKKNADVAEFARGKAGRSVGNLVSLLTTMKGLPFAYNRDLQEDKEVTFSSVENLLLLLPPLTGMIASTTFNRDVMRIAAPKGFSLATEIADYLVRKGVVFSQAHEAAGHCVKLCETQDKQLHELSATELSSAHPDLDIGVREVLTAEGAIASRTSSLGTSPSSVAHQIAELRLSFKDHLAWISNERARISGMMDL